MIVTNYYFSGVGPVERLDAILIKAALEAAGKGE
jgi:hypothetical protein